MGSASVCAKTNSQKLAAAIAAALRKHDVAAAQAILADAGQLDVRPMRGSRSVADEAAELCNDLWKSADADDNHKVSAAIEVLRVILAAGGKVQPGPLRDAAAFGNTALVKVLLEFGSDVNELHQGYSPFTAAVMFQQEDIAIELLRHGADPWAGEPMTFAHGPALHEAVVAGLVQTVRECVERKVNLNRRGDVAVGEAPPMTAVKVLDAKGGVVKTKYEVHPAPMARDSTLLIAAVRAGQLEIVELLVRGGADLDATDADGFTALAWAIKLERNDLAKLLRAGGPKEPTHLKGSPHHALITACKRGDLAAAGAAIAHGADVNAPCTGDEEFTALLYAARGGGRRGPE
jgi:Ankyrin repeats (3 copies)